MRWAWIAGILILTAGCIGGAGEETRMSPQEAEQLDEQQLEEVERELVFEEDVEPSAGEGRIDGIQWPAPLGPSLTSVELDFTWEQEANDFGLDVEKPDGSVEEIGPEPNPTSSSIEAEFPEAEPGTYVFYPTRDGVTTEDTLTLTVTATLVVPADESVSLAGCTDVEVQQTADGWRASFSCQASGPSSDAKRAEADTVNGEVHVDGDADAAMATVNAWARGDSEQEARQRAQSIDVTVRVDEGEIVARAEAPDWEDRGADVDLGVETATLSGIADTTNGPVVFSDVTTEGISADTTNGVIQGDLTGEGEVSLDTTNGPVDVALAPEGDMEIEADTTNGPIELGLLETSEIAYTVEASTTNGQISEDMDEARLEGSEDHATLVTEDGDSRPIQVTGDTSTTNGDIRFQGR